MADNGCSELWLKHRPTSFKDVVGQDAAVGLLKSYLKAGKVPRALLFTGPSGVGKSTMAGILAGEMGCKGMDLTVVNCATVEKPLDTIRDLQRQVKMSPCRGSPCRVWILEEVQALARATYAQQGSLLMLEDGTPASRKSHFMLCTTDPGKVRAEVKNRCKKVELKALGADDMLTLLRAVARKEGRDLPEAVADRIVEVAAGSAREAVNQLDSALAAGDDEESMLAVVSDPAQDDVAWKLIKALMYEKPKWDAVAAAIKEVADNHEQFRHRVLAIARTEMLKGGRNGARAYMIHDSFKANWYDCAESGLVGCCWDVVQLARRGG